MSPFVVSIPVAPGALTTYGDSGVTGCCLTRLAGGELLGDQERKLQGLHVVQARVAERLVPGG